MKTLIVYYSLTGNTEDTARRIAQQTGADLLRLVPANPYKDKGFAKFFFGGKSAVMAESPVLAPYEVNLAAYDRVVFGFPVWAGTFAPPIRTFIRDNAQALMGKELCAFACQSGAGAHKAFAKLSALLGIPSLARTAVFTDPRDKPSPETQETLAAFCREIGSEE